MNQTSSTPFRHDIQALRALAVVSVLLFHANEAWLPGGFLGVDIFFVISGFVITRKVVAEHDAGRFTFLGFYSGRVRRLFPALFATVAATLAVAPLVWSPAKIQGLIESGAASILSVANIYFYFKAGYFDTESVEKPLLHLWSLGVEEQYYLVFPALLIFVLLRGKVVGRALLVAGIFGGALASEMVLASDASASFFLTPLRFYQFFVGVLVAMWPTMISDSAKRGVLAQAAWLIGVIALIGAMLIWLGPESPLPGWRGLVVALATGLLLLVGVEGGVARAIVRAPPVQWLGNASYSLYLAHWPAVVFLNYRFAEKDPQLLGAVALVIGIILGGALHHCVEKPFRRRPLREVLAGPLVLSTSVFVASAVMFAGVYRPPLEVRVGDVSAESSPVAEGRRVLLLGDSNAHMYIDGVRDLIAVDEVNFELSYALSCPPLFGAVKRFGGGGQRELERACEVRSEVLENEVLASTAELVILGGRWELYVADPVEGAVPVRQDWLSFDGETASVAGTRRVFEAALRRTVSTLVESGRDVVLIGQLPAQPTSALRCAERELESGISAIEAKCGAVSAAVTRDRYATIDALFRDIAAAHDGRVAYWSIADMLCARDQCELQRGGELMYTGIGHVSRAAGKSIVRRALDRWGLPRPEE